jgi:hypothetical protein
VNPAKLHLIEAVLLLAQDQRFRRLAVIAAWCCVAVLSFASVAEARHFHASGTRDAQRCVVCAVSHSPTMLAKAAPLAPQQVSRPLPPAPDVEPMVALSLDSHSIRPPPVSLPA